MPYEGGRKAAWELCAELITHISIAELKPGKFLIGEAISSLHYLFETTMIKLRDYGPIMAKEKGESDLSLGISQ